MTRFKTAAFVLLSIAVTNVCVAQTPAGITFSAGLAGKKLVDEFVRNISDNCKEPNEDKDSDPRSRKNEWQDYKRCISNIDRSFQQHTLQQYNLIKEAGKSLIPLGYDNVEAAKEIEAAAIAKADEGIAQEQSKMDFAGFGWGAGIGYAWGSGPQRVASAEVVNNIVRVTSDVTNSPRVFLEAHRFFETDKGNWGHGPYAVVEAGSDGKAALGFGVGYMFGIKDPSSGSHGGFALGVGYVWEGSVQTLGDGIVANEPLPAGETQIRYKTVGAGAWTIVLSRKFDMSK